MEVAHHLHLPEEVSTVEVKQVVGSPNDLTLIATVHEIWNKLPDLENGIVNWDRCHDHSPRLPLYPSTVHGPSMSRPKYEDTILTRENYKNPKNVTSAGCQETLDE